MDEATVSETAQTNELASQAERSDNYTLIAKRSSLRDKFTDHKTQSSLTDYGNQYVLDVIDRMVHEGSTKKIRNEPGENVMSGKTLCYGGFVRHIHGLCQND